MARSLNLLNTKYKSTCETFDFPHVVFTLMFNSNIWLNSAPLQDIKLRNFNDPEFDLTRSLKVKCHGTTGLPIYSFLLMFNGTIWLSSAPFQDIWL